MNFNLTRPCGNCPFRVEGAIELRPGRLAGIVRALLADDRSSFLCHKTTHRKRAEQSVCAGAMVYLLKAGRPSVAMRLAFRFQMLDLDALRAQAALVVEPHSINDKGSTKDD